MEVVVDADVSKFLSSRYIYFDNDFLSILYRGVEVFNKVMPLFIDSFLFVDPFTRFEFLRGIYVPGEKEPMEKFIDSEAFTQPTNNNQIFQNIQTNALQLSLIYSHKGFPKGAGTIDLLLAGRLMTQANFKPLLVTGNKKDYPSCVFDTKSIISIEQNDGQMKPYCIVEFNQNKLEKCLSDLKQIHK